jgi:hypothetical protein
MCQEGWAAMKSGIGSNGDSAGLPLERSLMTQRLKGFD